MGLPDLADRISDRYLLCGIEPDLFCIGIAHRNSGGNLYAAAACLRGMYDPGHAAVLSAGCRDPQYGLWQKTIETDGVQIKNILCTLIAAAALGIAVNNIIAMTPLISASAGFQTANEFFFGGTVVYELLGSCLMVPIAEELLFRGVVYQRLKGMMGTVPQAIVLSALIFGAVHFNLVQFLYATVLGCLLAYLYEKTEYFYIPVLGHIAANTIAVWRAETGALSFAYEPSVKGIGFTIVMLLIAAGAIWIFHRNFSGKTE